MVQIFMIEYNFGEILLVIIHKLEELTTIGIDTINYLNCPIIDKITNLFELQVKSVVEE